MNIEDFVNRINSLIQIAGEIHESKNISSKLDNNKHRILPEILNIFLNKTGTRLQIDGFYGKLKIFEGKESLENENIILIDNALQKTSFYISFDKTQLSDPPVFCNGPQTSTDDFECSELSAFLLSEFAWHIIQDMSFQISTDLAAGVILKLRKSMSTICNLFGFNHLVFADMENDVIVIAHQYTEKLYFGTNYQDRIRKTAKKAGIELNEKIFQTDNRPHQDGTKKSSAIINDETFGNITKSTDVWTANLSLFPRKTSVDIVFYSENIDADESQMKKAVDLGKNVLEKFDEEAELLLRQKAAQEVVSSAYSQNSTKNTNYEKEIHSLVSDMSLSSIEFDDASALFVWNSPRSFPNKSITVQTDTCLSIEDISIQD